MFTIKYGDINKQGFTMFLNKLQHFPGFKGKTARRVGKLCLNLNATFETAISETKVEAERLGGKIEKGDWAFTDSENATVYADYFSTYMANKVEINCSELDFNEDIKPYEDGLKLTPLDYDTLEPFIINLPED